MAIKANPVIVRDGLVLALDAANLRSFDSYENLLLDTSQIGKSGSYIIANTPTVGLNTTATTAPNELNEATLLDNNNNGNSYVYSQNIGITTNTTYTYSIHIKQGTKPDFQITIDENSFGGKRYYSTFTYSTETITTGITGIVNDGVVVGSSVNKLTNGWYRLSLTFTTSTTSVSTFVDMINRFGNTSGSNYVWGRQLEKGTTVSTYYPTTSSAKNRGTTLTDLSGSSGIGTLTNGPTYNSSNGGSIVFDGTNDYVNCGNSFSGFDLIDKSFQGWIKRNSSSTGTIIDKDFDNGGSNYGGWGFWMQSNGKLQWWAQGQKDILDNGSNSAVVGTWTNVAVVWNSSTKTASFYINGVLNSSLTDATIVEKSSGSTNISIGAYRNGSANFTNGSISQLIGYTRQLTAAEVAQNYYATKSRYGL